MDTAMELVDGARVSMLGASHARRVRDRYTLARLAALRAAAAVVAVRGRADGSGPRDLWALLPSVAPELTEWADFFAVVTDRQWAADRGAGPLTVREADDLLRQVETFVGIVAGTLGLPRPDHTTLITPTDPTPTSTSTPTTEDAPVTGDVSRTA